MKRMVSLVGVVVVFLAGVALAQPAPSQPKSEAGAQHMHGGMCPMMSGGMMGKMGSQSDSPQMMQMRGEMMRAMGEVMMKYGRMMDGARPERSQ